MDGTIPTQGSEWCKLVEKKLGNKSISSFYPLFLTRFLLHSCPDLPQPWTVSLNKPFHPYSYFWFLLFITATEKQVKALSFYILFRCFQEHSHVSDFCYSQLLLMIAYSSEWIMLMAVFCHGYPWVWNLLMLNEACVTASSSFLVRRSNTNGAGRGKLGIDRWKIRYKLCPSPNYFLLN